MPVLAHFNCRDSYEGLGVLGEKVNLQLWIFSFSMLWTWICDGGDRGFLFLPSGMAVKGLEEDIQMFILAVSIYTTLLTRVTRFMMTPSSS